MALRHFSRSSPPPRRRGSARLYKRACIEKPGLRPDTLSPRAHVQKKGGVWGRDYQTTGTVPAISGQLATMKGVVENALGLELVPAILDATLVS